jgi:hypothetical protein
LKSELQNLPNWTIRSCCEPINGQSARQLSAIAHIQAERVIGDLRLLRRDRALPAITRRDSYRADWKAIAGSTFR